MVKLPSSEKGDRVADLLDRVHKEMAARLAELRPLVEEHRRLEAALGALNEVQSATPWPRAANASAAGGSRRRAGRNGGSASARKRAPRGANRKAVLSALRERPGSSSGELAAVSGVEGGTLHALLTRLVKDGEVEKQELPSGRTGYALSDRGPDESTKAVTVGAEETDGASASPSGGAAE